MSRPFIVVLVAALILAFLWRRSISHLLGSGRRAALREAETGTEPRTRGRAVEGEPLTQAEADGIVDAYRNMAQPALLLRPAPDLDPDRSFARLGGSVWFADDETWPVDDDGRRLEFVASIDFARSVPPEGFPNHGVARFFVPMNDLMGANFDDPTRSDAKVLWHEGPPVGGRLEQPAPLGRDDCSPWMDPEGRLNGIALGPTKIEDLPDYYSWQLQARLDAVGQRPGVQEVENRLDALVEIRPFAHRIGGHPTFTQYDFRKRGEHDDLDVLLLGLTSDDHLMWGDVGEAAFLISREDLARRNFTRIAFYWDCH